MGRDLRGTFLLPRDGEFVRADAVHVTHHVRHTAPHALHEIGALIVRETGGLDRLEEMNIDDAGAYLERALAHHLERAVYDRRNDRRLRRDREHEGTLLEWA